MPQVSPEYYFLNEHCLCLDYLPTDRHASSLSLSQEILLLWHLLRTSPLMEQLNIHDIVPTYTSLAFYFSSLTSTPTVIVNTLKAEIDKIARLNNNSKETPNPPASSTHTFVVDYCGEDLERVAAHAKLSTSQIVQKHQEPIYHIAMIGFLPNFPYLLGLPDSLHTPRLDSPRQSTPAGAVAIGGQQTGIYPSASPGGWNIIGYTNPDQLKNIQPGDSIAFTTQKNND